MRRFNVVLGGDGLLGTALRARLRDLGEEEVSFDLKRGFDLRHATPPPYDGDVYYWFLAWDVGGAKYIMSDRTQLGILRHNLALCERVFPWLSERKASFTFISTQMSGYPNAYGLTKAVGEFWARELGGRVVRLWNIYGAEKSSERSHVVPDLVTQGMRGQISLMTTGEERRQFLHVDDCVEALLVQRQTGQPIADVTSGEWVPIYDVASIVGHQTRAEVRRGPVKGYESIVEPRSQLEGWSPAIPLEQGLRQVIDRMRAEGWCGT